MGTAALPDRSVRALVVDEHDATRIGLGVLLRRQPWVGRCVLVPDRAEAVALLERDGADIALLDISNAAPFAVSAIAALRGAHAGLQVVLTSRCRTRLPGSPAAVGAAALLPPASSARETIAAVRDALLGTPAPPPPAQAPPDLSPRESEILELLATGATNREIAGLLHLAPDSVKKYATAVYRKLGVRNRTQAAQRATELVVRGGVGHHRAVHPVVPNDRNPVS
jgi:DNA-binding NarL/FixJ family response regulator